MWVEISLRYEHPGIFGNVEFADESADGTVLLTLYGT